MSMEEARRRIQEHTGTELDLSGLELTVLPTELWNLTNLTYLRLNGTVRKFV